MWSVSLRHHKFRAWRAAQIHTATTSAHWRGFHRPGPVPKLTTIRGGAAAQNMRCQLPLRDR